MGVPLGIDAALRQVAEWRAAGRRIVLANGCFDVLHVGHVRYLEAARALGDALVVAINSDASVRRLKGRGRPIMAEDERAELVASLRAVDLVVIFADDTVDALVGRLRPDVQAKGTDYTEATVPERAAVLAAGGRVAIAGDAKTHSTRDVIETIVRRFAPGGTDGTPGR
ncbi:MAG: adenylyltransferase/cytidyltransferase family protein [Candidatus Rokubacteria bacterium]|nr:adenylyltransferase/cytidyltransferase family protein [Candidatus Rokubacteria bacterium]